MLTAPGPHGASHAGPLYLALKRLDDSWELDLEAGSMDLALLIAYEPKRDENKTP